MKTYRKVNAESGMFIEDVRVKIMSVDEYDYIEEPVEGTFYKPKWDGEKWVEGLSEEEINELKKSHPVEISLEERLEFIKTQNELALAELAEVILGGML